MAIYIKAESRDIGENQVALSNRASLCKRNRIFTLHSNKKRRYHKKRAVIKNQVVIIEEDLLAFYRRWSLQRIDTREREAEMHL